ALSVLAGRVRPALNGALVGEALGALQEELGALTTALAATGAGVAHYLDPPALRGPAAVMRDRSHVLDGLDLQARSGERLDSRLAAGTRPLDAHVYAAHAHG